MKPDITPIRENLPGKWACGLLPGKATAGSCHRRAGDGLSLTGCTVPGNPLVLVLGKWSFLWYTPSRSHGGPLLHPECTIPRWTGQVRAVTSGCPWYALHVILRMAKVHGSAGGAVPGCPLQTTWNTVPRAENPPFPGHPSAGSADTGLKTDLLLGREPLFSFSG